MVDAILQRASMPVNTLESKMEKKMEVLYTRIPPELKKQIQQLANEKKRSLNNQVLILLERALQDRS
jgi:hypothetical protein